MIAVCKFLRIPYDQRMGTLQGADRSAIFSANHHAMVKGERIVPSSRRTEVLPPRLKKKVDRYVVYWKKRYQGSWPVYPLVPEGSAGAAFPERMVDSLAFAIFRAWDRAVALVYSFAPVFLLAAYRRVKGRWQQDTIDEEDGREFAAGHESENQNSPRTAVNDPAADSQFPQNQFPQMVEVGEGKQESRK